MTSAGYYRFPTIHDNVIVFVSEDDLWSTTTDGDIARRLTSNLGNTTHPSLSPDGEQLAFIGREEGAEEVYVMPSIGGSAHRLTYLSSRCEVLGWNAAGTHILFASNHGQSMHREMALFQIAADCTNGEVEPLGYGPARAVAFGADGETILGRNTGESAQWKRYRGGTAGHLWIDRGGDGQFERFLPNLTGNITSPMWINATDGPRIFFVSDHEGIGNLYSCKPDETDLHRHTDHESYYVRNPNTDGNRIVYHAGADLYVYNITAAQSNKLAVGYHSPRVQRNRKFIQAGSYLDDVSLDPSGHKLAITTRGKPFAFYNFDGPVLQFGQRDGVRYRLSEWLNDGRRLVMISDEPGEEVLEIHDGDPENETVRFDNLDLGRPISMKVSPTADKVAIANHRHELIIVDLTSSELTVADRSEYRRIAGFNWSPDGRWIAYGCSLTAQTTAIRLYRLPEIPAENEPDNASPDQDAVQGTKNTQTDDNETSPEEHQDEISGKVFTITVPILHDVSPAFDPEGKHLYFLSHREFNPVYDGLHFDLGFPWGVRPYLVTLRSDIANPFLPRPELEPQDGASDDGEDEDDDDERENEGYAHRTAAVRLGARSRYGAIISAGDPEEDTEAQHVGAEGSNDESADEADVESKAETPPRLQIDLDGIDRRIYAFPVPDGRYGSIAGIKGKALFTEFSLQGQLDGDDEWDDDDESESGSLRVYNFKEYRGENLIDGVNWFEISRDGEKLLYSSGRRIRVVTAGEKPPSGSGHPRKSGWIDLQRVKVSVDPHSEWEQMFREAWRLQRDQFWTGDMSEVDWQSVYLRYFPLIERVSTRSEFSDLMWEMQGELGTSHAYEFGGDYRRRPYYGQGFLGADLTWDAEADGYRIGEMVIGDSWDTASTSPLADPGLPVASGDVIIAVNGQRLNRETGPAQLLVNQAGNEVLLTLVSDRKDETTEADELADIVDGTNVEAPADPADVDNATDTIDDDQPERRLRNITVRTIRSEAPARYRDWVEGNRAYVHQQSNGRVGYVHIPDMSARGYAEFHRGYLGEIDHDALIVDVRYNGGGHVSQLILEKLARRRLGYDWSRWGGIIPYPQESVAGPLVALTNEHAGSDGDIFCHSFKMMKLGPLIGKRTWGGVIGIFPRHSLVDGTITTQPEFSFWFDDVGWNVENYGTEPDIEVDITPQDYAAGRDPQLDRSIEEAIKLLAEHPVVKPDISTRPSRALPSLPPRG